MPDPPSENRTRQAEEAKVQYQDSIQYVTEEEVAIAARSGQEKLHRLEKAIPRSLEAIWSDVKLLVRMVRDYVSGVYRDVPFGTIAAVAAAILYFVSPFDMIPDFIPGFGYMDDAAVIALCLRMVHADVEKYRDWMQSKTVDASKETRRSGELSQGSKEE